VNRNLPGNGASSAAIWINNVSAVDSEVSELTLIRIANGVLIEEIVSREFRVGPLETKDFAKNVGCQETRFATL
jgi:hypothetical protein